MAKAKKLPSGNWHVKVYDFTDNDGKRHYESFTAPTKKEAEYLAARFALDKKERSRNRCNKQYQYENLTVGEATDRYIKSKDVVLAGDTIVEYERIRKQNMKLTMNTRICDLTQEIIQEDINEESKKISYRTKEPISPKTIANMHGLISAVLSVYAPTFKLNTTLPQKKRPTIYVPTDEEIKLLIKFVSGTAMEIPILLSAFGSLRRSEICALNCDDVIDNVGISVSKAMIKGRGRQWLIKLPKTESSQRIAHLPPFVMQKLPASGSVTNLNPDNITDRFRDLMSKANLVDSKGKNKFRFHDLRHYYASISHALGIPDKYIMKQGGWSTDVTLKKVYQHTMADKENEFVLRSMQHFEKMQHEMQHDDTQDE